MQITVRKLLKCSIDSMLCRGRGQPPQDVALWYVSCKQSTPPRKTPTPPPTAYKGFGWRNCSRRQGITIGKCAIMQTRGSRQGGTWLSLLKFLSGPHCFRVAHQVFVYQMITGSYSCELLPFSFEVSDPCPIFLSSGRHTHLILPDCVRPARTLRSRGNFFLLNKCLYHETFDFN